MFTPEERANAINTFLDEVKLCQKQLIEVLKKVIGNKSISESEIYSSIAKINFFQLMQSKTNINEAITKFLSQYDAAIKKIMQYAKNRGLQEISGISLEQLASIKQLDSYTILRRGEMFGNELKSELAKVILSGVSRKTIIDRLLPQINEAVVFHSHWFRVALNQSFTHFQNLAMQKAFESDEEQRFTLVHPVDSRNRPECVKAIEINKQHPEGFTVKEINNGALGSEYTFLDLGGFNCRGFFKPI